MADVTATHPKTAPTLFISYASEDRAAARRLRDAMSQHGIDVWYDEDELTGGDAWDKKIRDRIRACDYFMPLISKSTEARREGYFRREWRQAAERTLDMSDDVMFLLPINIDDIAEYGARVPERFTQVQWTLCPDGEPNSNFDALCARILRGDAAHPLVAPPLPSKTHPRESSDSTEIKKNKGKALPPYPPQPKRTADEPAWLHVFNLLVWIVRCAYRAYRGFPRILRWVVIAWAIVFLIKSCEGIRDEAGSPLIQVSQPKNSDASDSPKIPVDVDKMTQELKGLEKFGGLGRIIGVVADAAQSGRTLALVPFATTSDSASANELVDSVFAQLMTALRAIQDDRIAVSPNTLGTNPPISDLITRTARIEAKFLLAGWIETDPTDQTQQLVVVLHEAASPTSKWTGRYSLAEASASAIAKNIEEAILGQRVFDPPSLDSSTEPPPVPTP